MKTPLNPLVSVLLPTRKRFPMLLDCIESIVASASGKHEYEIIVRIHRDDGYTVSCIGQLLGMANVKIVVGYPFSGYDDLSRFYQDAAGVANGKYVWVMNDDVIVSGSAWDEAVFNAPKDKILMPEIHRLGKSTYFNDVCNPFMVLPNRCWENYGVRYFDSPFDKGLWDLLRKHGWETHFLKGVSVHHQREDDSTLLPSRIKDYQDSAEHHMENL